MKQIEQTQAITNFILIPNDYNQWRLVVKLAGRAAKFNLWLNIWDCRPGCFYNIVAFPVTPAVLILQTRNFQLSLLIHRKQSLQFN